MSIINTNSPSRRPVETQVQNGTTQKNLGPGKSISLPNNVGYAGQAANFNFSTNFTVTANPIKVPGTINVELGPSIIVTSIIVNGTTLQTMASGVTPVVQIQGTTQNTSSQALWMYSNDANSAAIYFAKSRGTSIGSLVAVQSGDSISIQSNNAVNSTNTLVACGYYRMVVAGISGAWVPTQWQWSASTSSASPMLVMSLDALFGLTVNFNGKFVGQLQFARQNYLNYPNEGSTSAINISNGGMQYCFVNANSTLSLSGGVGGERANVVMKNTALVAVTITIPTGISTSGSSNTVIIQPNTAVLFDIVCTGSIYFVNAMSYAAGYIYP